MAPLPPAGIKAVADCVREQGLLLGIYGNSGGLLLGNHGDRIRLLLGQQSAGQHRGLPVRYLP